MLTKTNQAQSLWFDSHGTRGGQHVIEQMTDHIARGKLETARIFHRTCPDEWGRGQDVGFGETLRGFHERDEYQGMAPVFEAAMRFRWAALLADYIVDLFELPIASKETCIMWNRLCWIESNRKIMPDLGACWRKAYKSLSAQLETPGLNEQGPPFHRPLHCLVAAFVESDKLDNEMLAIMSAIGELMSQVRMFYLQCLYAN
jgi:hypothetical protein